MQYRLLPRRQPAPSPRTWINGRREGNFEDYTRTSCKLAQSLNILHLMCGLSGRADRPARARPVILIA